MKTTTVKLSDDLGGAGDAESVTFSFKGVDYEIDLNKRNRETFERHMQRWINGGRTTASHHDRHPSVKTAKPAENAASTVLNARIRVWASLRGLDASSGVIPDSVINAFYEAHPHLARD
jgi:hypothetical protein